MKSLKKFAVASMTCAALLGFAYGIPNRRKNQC